MKFKFLFIDIKLLILQNLIKYIKYSLNENNFLYALY